MIIDDNRVFKKTDEENSKIWRYLDFPKFGTTAGLIEPNSKRFNYFDSIRNTTERRDIYHRLLIPIIGDNPKNTISRLYSLCKET